MFALRFGNFLFVLISLCLVSGCHEFKGADVPVQLEQYKATSGLVLKPDIQANFYQDVPYGEGAFQSFDFYQLKNQRSAPLVIYLHGGAFLGGDKTTKAITADVNKLLSSGVNLIALNYALLSTAEIDKEGIGTPLSDITQAIDYISRQATNLGINIGSVGLYGDSVGGSLALWYSLGVNNKEVTPLGLKVKAVAATEAQASLDLVVWQEQVFSAIGFDIQWLVDNGFDWYVASYYGLNDIPLENVVERLNSEDVKLISQRQSYDVTRLIDADDPAVYLSNVKAPFDLSKALLSGNSERLMYSLFHHQLHVNTLYQKAVNEGLIVHARAPNLGLDTTEGLTVDQFLIDSLTE